MGRTPTSDDVEDDRVVWTRCKNNDGQLGSRSAWYRRNGLFLPCSEFDWQEFDDPSTENAAMITKGHLDRLFNNGKRTLVRKHAAEELEAISHCKKPACYNALNLNGRFKNHLSEDDSGLLSWRS
ncbi:MAG: hypothetical protein HY735_03295 [Verrucomicrobia bacterium]|nr:hypothetical protein [Verrucomicrobiota bacterium]